MAGINRVLIVGRLTRDPEVKSVGDSTVCEFALAVNSREKNGDTGEWQDRADFFDVAVWGAQAEACGSYLSKGKLTGVDGRLRQDRWEKDGQKRSRIRIVASNVQFLDGGSGQGQQAPAPVVPDDEPPI
jgi:single-strand DNA-binding protein